MRKTDELLQKYWEGKTTLDEERWLKEHLEWDDNKGQDAVYFNYLKSRSEEKITKGDFNNTILSQINSSNKKHKSIHINYWRVAAAVLLLISAAIVLNEFAFNVPKDTPGKNVVILDTYEDPEKALEETKKALMFLSGKLNEGGAYTAEIRKFNESQEILKNE